MGAVTTSRLSRVIHWKIAQFFLLGACLGALLGYGISAAMRRDPTPTYFPIFFSSSMCAWIMFVYALRRYAGSEFEGQFLNKAK